MTTNLPSPEFLRKILRYEPDTGKLFWRYRMPDTFECAGCLARVNAAAAFNKRFCDKEAFTNTDGGGYRCGKINSKPYKAAHVVWAITNNQWPQETGFVIDHVNRVRTDNRLLNLRLVTQAQNSWNRTGVQGVYLDRRTSRWEARITVHGKQCGLGRFDSREEARTARTEAELERDDGWT